MILLANGAFRDCHSGKWGVVNKLRSCECLVSWGRVWGTVLAGNREGRSTVLFKTGQGKKFKGCTCLVLQGYNPHCKLSPCGYRRTKKDYLEIGVPLYEAAIKCDWEDAKDILVKRPELVKYSITENREIDLYIVASAKGPKHVEQFVKNLVGFMSKDDLELVNKNHNIAFYLAAAAGNVKTVKIMVEKDKALLTTPGTQTFIQIHNTCEKTLLFFTSETTWAKVVYQCVLLLITYKIMLAVSGSYFHNLFSCVSLPESKINATGKKEVARLSRGILNSLETMLKIDMEIPKEANLIVLRQHITLNTIDKRKRLVINIRPGYLIFQYK
nr:ankyrin repeat-containing domain, PGG domain protein [Tanacetum cinerariifolium]